MSLELAEDIILLECVLKTERRPETKLNINYHEWGQISNENIPTTSSVVVEHNVVVVALR